MKLGFFGRNSVFFSLSGVSRGSFVPVFFFFCGGRISVVRGESYLGDFSVLSAPHFVLMSLGKARIDSFSLQLRVNSKADCIFNLAMVTNLGERKLWGRVGWIYSYIGGARGVMDIVGGNECKYWTRLVAFHIALIQLSSLLLWVNSRTYKAL